MATIEKMPDQCFFIFNLPALPIIHSASVQLKPLTRSFNNICLK